MTVSAGDALPFPVYAGRFRVVFALLDNDGDLVTGATTPDSERSIDMGTFADCTNEMTEIATASGMYYLDLTATETTCSCLAIIAKSATAGMKTTPMVLYPRRFPTLRSGTAQAGAASTITLDSGASAQDNYYNGCLVQCSNDSPANVQGQTRWIISYVGSTRVATVNAAWGTNPSSATTFLIFAPESANQVGLHGDGTVVTSAGLQTIAHANLDAAVSSRATPAQVNTEVLDVLTVDTFAEVSGVIAATSTLKDKLNWLFALARNKVTMTSTTQTLRNDADAADVATAAQADNGTTYTRSEWT